MKPPTTGSTDPGKPAATHLWYLVIKLKKEMGLESCLSVIATVEKRWKKELLNIHNIFQYWKIINIWLHLGEKGVSIVRIQSHSLYI